MQFWPQLRSELHFLHCLVANIKEKLNHVKNKQTKITQLQLATMGGMLMATRRFTLVHAGCYPGLTVVIAWSLQACGPPYLCWWKWCAQCMDGTDMSISWWMGVRQTLYCEWFIYLQTWGEDTIQTVTKWWQWRWNRQLLGERSMRNSRPVPSSFVCMMTNNGFVCDFLLWRRLHLPDCFRWQTWQACGTYGFEFFYLAMMVAGSRLSGVFPPRPGRLVVWMFLVT